MVKRNIRAEFDPTTKPKKSGDKDMAFSDFCRSWKPMIKTTNYENIDWRVWMLYKKPILTKIEFDEWIAGNKTNPFQKPRVPKREDEVAVKKSRMACEMFIESLRNVLTSMVEMDEKMTSMKDKDFKSFAKNKIEKNKGSSSSRT